MICDRDGKPMAIIDSPALKQLEFCNSPRINGKDENGVSNSKIIKNGIIYEWVGIGWIVLGSATDEEKTMYTELVNP